MIRALLLLFAGTAAWAQSTTVTNIALYPAWTLLGKYNDAAKTYTVQPGQTVRYGTSYPCGWLVTATKQFSAFAGQDTAYLYYTNKGTTAVAFKGDAVSIDKFFGSNPAVWCDKSVWRQDPPFPASSQKLVCQGTCVTLLQNTDPKVALRLTSGGAGAYVETMTLNEIAAWAAAVQAYRSAWLQGMVGPQLSAVTDAMNKAGIKIGQAHGCKDSTSFQIVDPGFVVVLNGTPPFVGTNVPLPPLPAGAALLSTTGPVGLGLFSR